MLQKEKLKNYEWSSGKGEALAGLKDPLMNDGCILRVSIPIESESATVIDVVTINHYTELGTLSKTNKTRTQMTIF